MCLSFTIRPLKIWKDSQESAPKLLLKLRVNTKQSPSESAAISTHDSLLDLIPESDREIHHKFQKNHRFSIALGENGYDFLG